MALLTDQQRREPWAEFQRLNTDPVGITKPELRAAIDAVDAWVDANAAALNAAIPQPARGALTVRQKAMLLAYVVLQRFKVL